VSAFVLELLMCRPSCRKCGCQLSCRLSSCRFWKPPHVEEVLLKFSTFLYNLDFYLVTHVQILFFSDTRGRRLTMSEGCRGRTSGHPQLEHHRDRTSGHPQLEHRRDPSCREPLADSFICIALVNLE
jgi:hypothetical protein